MSEEINNSIITDSSVYDSFPFLSAFPFKEYSISMDKIDSESKVEIDPIITKEVEQISLDFINFRIKDGEEEITFSFYTFDMEFICDVSSKVRKLDLMREKLDAGLNSDYIHKKVDSIKDGIKFIKKLGPSLLPGSSFDPILDGIITTNNIVMSNKLIKDIKSIKNIEEDSLTGEVYDAIMTFYDLHIHHIKILLGIIIANKIF